MFSPVRARPHQHPEHTDSQPGHDGTQEEKKRVERRGEERAGAEQGHGIQSDKQTREWRFDKLVLV